MVDLKQRVVSLSTETAQLFKDQLVLLAIPYLQPKPQAADPHFLSSVDFRKRLDVILQDLKIDRIEAPTLFTMTSMMAGEDRILSREEIDADELDLWQHYNIARGMDMAWDAAVNNAINAIFGIEPDNTAHRAETIARQGLFTVLDGSFLLTKRNRADETQLLQQLDLADQLVTNEIARLKIYIKKLQQDGASFTQFTNPENGWGFSAFLSEDGSPFSVLEFDGAIALQDYLSRVQTGLHLFKAGLQKEILPLENPFVITFLNSSFVETLDLEKFYGDGSDSKKDPKDPAMIHFYRRFIEEARDAGALKYAYLIANTALAEYGQTYSNYLLYKPLPRDIPFIREDLTDFANHSLNLPSIGISAASGFVGAGLAATKKGISLMESVYEFLGPLHHLLPGVDLIPSTAGQSAFRSIPICLGNFSAELGKFAGINWLGHWLGRPAKDETGEAVYLAAEEIPHNLDNLTLFVAGINAGYASALEQRLMSEATASRSSAWFESLTAKNILDRSRLEQLINRAAATGRRRTLRLSRREDPKPLQKKLKQKQRQLNRLSRNEQRFREQIDRHYQRLQEFKTKYGDQVDEALMQKVETLFQEATVETGSLEKIALALEELRRQTTEMEAQFRRTAAVALKPKPTTREAPKDPPPSQKGPRREKAQGPADESASEAAQNGNGAPTTTEGTPKPVEPRPTPPAELKTYQINPPTTLSPEILEATTLRRVNFDPTAFKEIQAVYQTLRDGEKRVFWHCVEELTDTALSGSAFLKGNWHKLRLRELPLVKRFSSWVGGRRYRIVVERENGHFRVIALNHRREVYGDKSNN